MTMLINYSEPHVKRVVFYYRFRQNKIPGKIGGVNKNLIRKLFCNIDNPIRNNVANDFIQELRRFQEKTQN